MDICHSSLNRFILPSLQGRFVVDYYQTLHSRLLGRDDFPFPDCFANPRVRTASEIVWSSDLFVSQPKALTTITGETRVMYDKRIALCLHTIERLASIIEKEEGGASFAELLRLCISYVDTQQVFCADNNFVFVNWGLIPRIPTPGFRIRENGSFCASWKRIINEALRSERFPVFVQTPSETVCGIDNERISSREVTTPHANHFLIGKNDLQSVPENPPRSRDNTPFTDVSESGVKEEQSFSSDSMQINLQPAPAPEPQKNHKKKSWLLGFLLIIAAVCGALLLWFFFRNPLPSADMNVLSPIPPEMIGLDRDGIYTVARDRLNVMLDMESGATVRRFARDFKRAYPNAHYKVLSYNEALGLLQIAVPNDQLETVMDELPRKINKYGFIIFYEALSSGSRQFNDPGFDTPSRSWYLDAIHAEEAWQIEKGKTDIIVAVIDVCFDLGHPELAGKIVTPINVAKPSAGVYRIYGSRLGDREDHGNHVASLAVGNANNGTGVSGIAPGCTFMPIQVMGSNGYIGSFTLVSAARYAIYYGASVVNLSLGLIFSERVLSMSREEQIDYIRLSNTEDKVVWDAIYAEAARKNCTFVWAAGNDNILAGMDFKKRNPSIIIVSASNKYYEKASFSNYGLLLNDQKLLYSTVTAPGISIYSASFDSSYVFKNGTSMAAPIVSGAIALLKSIDRNLTNGEIQSIFSETGYHICDSIGNFLQLDKALLSLPSVKRQMAYQRRKELQRELDSLDLLFPLPAKDTLKFQDIVYSPSGVWKSSTDLIADSDGSPVSLFFSFSKEEGTICYNNKGHIYKAPLSIRTYKNRIVLNQVTPATSEDDNNTFKKAKFIGIRDNQGRLRCTCIYSGKPKFDFYLVKVDKID